MGTRKRFLPDAIVRTPLVHPSLSLRQIELSSAAQHIIWCPPERIYDLQPIQILTVLKVFRQQVIRIAGLCRRNDLSVPPGKGETIGDLSRSPQH